MAEFEVIKVCDLKGRLRIPAYQRGYRWTHLEVSKLLDDIVSAPAAKPYYLQPVILVPTGARGFDYDIVDGQQRLTTVLLIYKFLGSITVSGINSASVPLMSAPLQYTIAYETRKETGTFIDRITDYDDFDANENDITATPDSLYIWHAYRTIREWFKERGIQGVANVATRLSSIVKIIRYVADKDQRLNIFDRLNAGRIPLTNSELVKALFLSQSGGNREPEQKEIAANWQEMEQELADGAFWGFLTNKPKADYDTLIDLWLDALAGKTSKDKDDSYFTFNYFEVLEHDFAAWRRIYLGFRRFYDLFHDRRSYHRIGYLLCYDKEGILHRLLAAANDMSKSELNKSVEQSVRNLLPRIDSIDELNYNKPKEVERVLTWANILEMEQEQNNSEHRYPFHRHKSEHWSIEHIHAQNSKRLQDKRLWKEWAKSHQKSLTERSSEIKAAELIAKMDNLMSENKQYFTQEYFDEIMKDYYQLMTAEGDEEYKDRIGNLTLLGGRANSSIGNEVFADKRDAIIRLIPKTFIPVLTQRVFMKSFRSEGSLYFWSDDDRQAYTAYLKELLKDYLPNKRTDRK